jgi:hypothetical protein
MHLAASPLYLRKCFAFPEQVPNFIAALPPAA